MKRMLILLALSLVLTSCGIKSDLVTPSGDSTPKGQQDPSKPPQPVGK